MNFAADDTEDNVLEETPSDPIATLQTLVRVVRLSITYVDDNLHISNRYRLLQFVVSGFPKF